MRVLYVAVTLAVFLLVSGAEEKKAEGKKEEKKKDEEDVGTVIGIDLGTTYSWYVCKIRLSYLTFCICSV